MNNGQLALAESTCREIKYAFLDDGNLAVVRVEGRGNFMNSVPLRKFAETLARDGKPQEFLIDLKDCETLDSTFMGVLASISLHQSKAGRQRLLVANPNDHVQRLLKTLGLSNLLTMCGNGCGSEALKKAEDSLKPAPCEEISHKDQLNHTLQAHQTLAKIDGENEVRFQSVIHYLEKSLTEEER